MSSDSPVYLREHIREILRRAATCLLRVCRVVLIVALPGLLHAASERPFRDHGETYRLNLNEWIGLSAMKGVTLEQALLSEPILQEASIALEVVQPQPRVSIGAQTKRLKELLDVIVGQCPGYRWEAVDGIVRVFPSDTLKEDTSLKELDARIREFKSEEYDIGTTIRWLRGRDVLPDVPSRRLSLEAVAGLTAPEARVAVTVPDGKTLREALNAIIRADLSAFWIACGARDQELTLGGMATHNHTRVGFSGPFRAKYASRGCEPSPRELLEPAPAQPEAEAMMRSRSLDEIKWRSQYPS